MSFTGSAFRMTHMRAVGGAGVGRGSQGLLELGGGAGREGQRCLLKQLPLRTCAPVGPGPISQSDPPRHLQLALQPVPCAACQRP